MRTVKTLIRLGGTLGPQLPIKRTAKTDLFSLGAHAILLVLSWVGSNFCVHLDTPNANMNGHLNLFDPQEGGGGGDNVGYICVN